ncbi:chloride channel protein [Liquorilactobacillus sicerae]|uniref:chloride channel protein n=1 Tax=Liquorilactobacillus sicerae TaxID=1416943 RepID=UPI002480EEC8
MKIIVRKNQVLIISTLILGVVVGLSSLGLILLLNSVEQLFLSFKESAADPASIAVRPIQRLISVFIGGVVAAIIWWVLKRKFKPTVSIAKALQGKQMPFGSTIIHVMTQIFYVGTGGSVGRELAPREAGAMFAQKWNRVLSRVGLNLSTEDQKLLVAAAAGAGFAGVYSAPITGMFFCVEILLHQITKKTVTVSLTMSIISMLIGTLVKGFEPYYLVGHQKFDLIFLLIVIITAPIFGVLGTFFRKAFKRAGRFQVKDKRILYQLPAAAFLTGLISLNFPQIMGNGRALAQFSIKANSPKWITLLLLGALLKAIVTVLTLRTGASGGTLQPSISIGAALGAIVGIVLQPIFPMIAIWQCALLGGCSLLAASQQAPLMALFMIIEVSHLGYSAFLPLGLGVAVSIGTSKLLLQKLDSTTIN